MKHTVWCETRDLARATRWPQWIRQIWCFRMESLWSTCHGRRSHPLWCTWLVRITIVISGSPSNRWQCLLSIDHYTILRRLWAILGFSININNWAALHDTVWLRTDRLRANILMPYSSIRLHAYVQCLRFSFLSRRGFHPRASLILFLLDWTAERRTQSFLPFFPPSLRLTK